MTERRGGGGRSRTGGVPLAALCLFAACADPVDKAAKKRIFSPEDPPQAVASAKEQLKPEDVADKPRVARRILGMGAAEATERLGPHKFTAQVKFEWTAGKRSLKLNEQRTLLAGAGGVSGDFDATAENSRDQGFEVMRVQNVVYARNRYGKFRMRKRDRGMAERVRDEVHGVIRDFDQLYKGRMKLTPEGTVSHEGRTAWRYRVSLGPEAAAQKPPEGIPNPLTPKGGVDDTTKKRMAFTENRQPSSLEGEVFVDAQTSVVVKARLDGRIKQPNSPAGGEAFLSTSMHVEVTGVGKNPVLQPPKDFLPDEDKPEGIASVLERFGLDTGTGKPDAGSVEEPPDEAP
ncbi:MAG: hypothetical protein ACT4TC_02350 [Myxococcaceae bacterium]